MAAPPATPAWPYGDGLTTVALPGYSACASDATEHHYTGKERDTPNQVMTTSGPGTTQVRDVPHLAEIWSYINPHMLYGKHLGYKGNFEKSLAEHEPKALDLFHKLKK